MLHLKHYCKFCGHELSETAKCKNKDCLNYTPDTGTETAETSTPTPAAGTSTTA